MNHNKNDRYEDEIIFFDKIFGRRLEIKNKFTLNNNKNYEELFNDIIQLRPIVKYFGEIKGKRILDWCREAIRI